MPMESSWEETCLESDLGQISSVSEISAVGTEDGGKMGKLYENNIVLI